MNAIDELINRLDMAEERSFELEDMTKETSKKKKKCGILQEKQRTSKTNRKQLTTKVDINSNTSVITLNISELNTPIGRDYHKDPTTGC